ncbi:MAG: maleylpyruvate isomerase family mycothiol-dependent enzyme [Actinomycetota bacterium]|nr:maleylpyruvate isomerase family mycothiol-dependent enzyme [Actinomycetota bacterium]
MGMARAERAELADLLAGLTPEQWASPTLCEGWTVRDLVAHVYGYEDIGFTGFLSRFVRARLDPGRANEIGVAEQADLSPSELLARARRFVQPRGFTTLMGGRIALVDGMIHHQDIRRPLGLGREIPPERLTVALDFARTAPPIGARKRIAGLRIVATDLGWATGDGPAVEGRAEPVLMAIAGRRGVADELSGPGVATLRDRIGG